MQKIETDYFLIYDFPVYRGENKAGEFVIFRELPIRGYQVIVHTIFPGITCLGNMFISENLNKFIREEVDEIKLDRLKINRVIDGWKFILVDQYPTARLSFLFPSEEVEKFVTMYRIKFIKNVLER